MSGARTWDELSPSERRDLYGVAVDRAMDGARGVRPAGDPPPPNANADVLPDWARDRGITQSTWTGMNAEQREAERQRWIAASGRGWETAQTIVTQGVSVLNTVLRGDTERDIERIRQQGAMGAAERRAAADEFVARTNLQIAQLRAAAQADPAQAQQFQQAVDALRASQAEAQGRQSSDLAAILAQMRASQPQASNMTPILVGVGVLGLGALALLRR